MGNHTLIGQNKQCTESGGLQNSTNKIRAEKDGDDGGDSAALTTVWKKNISSNYIQHINLSMTTQTTR